METNQDILKKMEHMVSLYKGLINGNFGPKHPEIEDIYKENIIKNIKKLETVIWCVVADDFRRVARKRALKEILEENGYPDDINLT
jgi:hypothetical protein